MDITLKNLIDNIEEFDYKLIFIEEEEEEGSRKNILDEIRHNLADLLEKLDMLTKSEKEIEEYVKKNQEHKKLYLRFAFLRNFIFK